MEWTPRCAGLLHNFSPAAFPENALMSSSCLITEKECPVYLLLLVSLAVFKHVSSVSSTDESVTSSPATTPASYDVDVLTVAPAAQTAMSRGEANGRALSWPPSSTTRSFSSWEATAPSSSFEDAPPLRRSPFANPRRASYQYKRYAGAGSPLSSIYEDDNDYSDYHQSPTYHHHPSWHHSPPPVYYVDSHSHHSKDSSWDMTTKLIVLAILKIFLTKLVGLGFFKLVLILLIKVPFVVVVLAAKFAIFLKFLKFLKLLSALLLIPLFLLALLPLLLPLLLLLLPLLLLPLLLLFPVPVLAPNAGAGGVNVGAGRRRRSEDDVNRIHNAVLDAQTCLQRLACHVGEASRPTVAPYAMWSLWLLDLVRPLFPEPKRDLLASYSEAYRSGITGSSCASGFNCKIVDQSVNSTSTSDKSRGRRRPFTKYN